MRTIAEVFPWARRGVIGRRWTDDAWTVKGAEEAVGKDATCRAMGLRSARAGARLDDLLADDMIGPQETESAAAREKASRTLWSVIDRMVVPGGTRWFLGTRWHEDDLYAELIRKGFSVHLRRAIADDGSALWPALYPLEGPDGLHAIRATMGSAVFDLQMQSDPTNLAGNLIKRAWLGWVDVVPAGARRVGVDLAASAKERADDSAAVEVVEDANHTLFIVGAWRAKLDDEHRAWLTGRTDLLEPRSAPPTAILTARACCGRRRSCRRAGSVVRDRQRLVRDRSRRSTSRRPSSRVSSCASSCAPPGCRPSRCIPTGTR